MPTITVASYNVEKGGVSSEQVKQTIISDFVDSCRNREVGLIFLCEIHSARKDDFIDHLTAVYQDYESYCIYGGYSNNYVVMMRKDEGFILSFDQLRHLNRSLAICSKVGADKKFEVSIGLAHFKSGQTLLTAGQIKECASFIDEIQPLHKWAIVGDMNFDFRRADELTLPDDSRAVTCWNDRTQRKGGILDWALGGVGLVSLSAADGLERYADVFDNDEGPDHKPVMFHIEY